MSGLLDGLLNLTGLVAYSVVAVLAFAEAAAFVGLVVPGELAVLLGGVLASNGTVSLPVMIAVAVVAAILGDSAGYELGRRVGPRIVAWEPFATRFGGKVDQAAAYLHERGGRAVFLGRWTSVLRALIPGLAGMARMPYRRFLAFNVAGGVAWATTFVLLGYAAGASYRTVERVAGQASLLLVVLLTLGFGVRWATRRLVARPDDVRARLDRVASTRSARWVARRFAGPLDWVRRRTTPGTSAGLGWTMTAVVAVLSLWLLGGIAQDLVAREGVAVVDRTVASWVDARSTPGAVRVAAVGLRAVGVPSGSWLVLLLAAFVGRTVTRSAGVRVVVAALLSTGAALAVTRILPVAIVGPGFPDADMAWQAAAFAAAIASWSTVDLRAAIRLAGVAVALLVLVSVAGLLASVTTASGLAAGLGLGVLVASGVELTHRTVGADPPEVSTRR